MPEVRPGARFSNFVVGALFCVASGWVSASEDNPDGFFVRPSLSGDWGGLRSKLEDQGIVFSLTQTSDVMGNVNGGVRRGVEYDGLFQPQVDMDLGKLMGWSGGRAHVSAYVVQGKKAGG